jgi:hypothetical protein
VVNVRFSTSAITQGAAELYVSGTAVKLTGGDALVSTPPPVTVA